MVMQARLVSMAVVNGKHIEYYGAEFKAAVCSCGRMCAPNHCRSCGSTNVYGRDKSGFRYAEGDTIVQVPGFHCRYCGQDFNLAVECEAPQFEHKSMKERRAVDAASDAIKAAIADATKNCKTPEEAHAAKMKVIGEFARQRLLAMAPIKGPKQ